MRTLLEQMAQRLAASPLLDNETRADAARESRLLAAAVLGCAPGDIARRVDRPLPHTERDRILAATDRRARGEPLAYAVGSAAFRHLTLRVDPRVLIPRPETEGVVDEVLAVVKDNPGGIAVDIGTGSGRLPWRWPPRGTLTG
ncbi:MAG: hypothetical protein IPP90_11305 [Gemmatimonadaceae bacterium]|nr:hypothetical protein [Gemmatimonadaceae bacterium]